MTGSESTTKGLLSHDSNIYIVMTLGIIIGLTAFRVLDLSGGISVLFEMLILLYVILHAKDFLKIKFNFIFIVLMAVPILQTLAFGTSDYTSGSIRVILFSILSFLFGYIVSNSIDLSTTRRILLIIRNFVLISCVFGIVFLFVFRRGFYSDIAILEGTGRTSFRYFETYHYTAAGVWNVRMASFFTHPIIFAHYILIGFVINIKLENNSTVKLLSNILMIICLFFTGTRGAWLIFAAIVIFEAIKSVSLTRTRVSNVLKYILLLFIVIILLIRFGYIDIIINRFLRLGEDNSFFQRASTISFLLKQLLDDPVRLLLGFGGGAAKASVGNAVVYKYANWDIVDNQYLTLLYDYGVFVVIGYIVCALSSCIPFIKGDVPKEYETIAIAGILTSLGNMCFFDLWHWNSAVFVLFGSIGYLARRKTEKKTALDKRSAELSKTGAPYE